jgi:YgiT-type zinc finger domain-containing protein
MLAQGSMKSLESSYGYRCEYCEGTVRPKKVEREAFKHKKGFIILEDVVIGVCDVCGSRYYSAEILGAVNDIANLLRELKKFLSPIPRHPDELLERDFLRKACIWFLRLRQTEFATVLIQNNQSTFSR